MFRLLLAAIALIASIFTAEARPPQSQAEAWFYIARNAVEGPYGIAEMRHLAADGVIRPTTQVYDPAKGWAFAKDTPALQRALGGGQPETPKRAAPVTGPEIRTEPLPVPPPVPPQASRMSVQAELDRTIRDFLVGGWRSTEASAMLDRDFTLTVDYRFRADGTYDGVLSTTMPDAPDLPPTTETTRGTWRVTARSPESFTLTLEEDAGLPFDETALRIESRSDMISADGAVRYRRIP